jgi:hypothetical protein
MVRERKTKIASFIRYRPAAAGKSTLSDPLIEKTGSLLIDADEAKKLIDGYNDGAGAGAVHNESVIIAEEMIWPQALEAGDNIIFPKIGKNVKSLKLIFGDAKKYGYTIHLIVNELPPEKAARSAYGRYKETGRFVAPEEILKEIAWKPREVYDILKSEADEYERYSNDVERGQPPRLLTRSGEADQGTAG